MQESKQISLNTNPESLEEIEQQSKAILDVAITSLYGEPALSSVREILSNALDANWEAGADRPVEISYSSEKQSLKIRDFGPGLDPEKMDKLYGRLFSSSKRNNPNQIGRFGVGRLSVLSHTKRFFLYTFVGGIKYKYKVFLDSERELPSYRLIEEEETDEPNGTSVFIPEIMPREPEVWEFLVKQGSFNPNRITFKEGMEGVQKSVEEELSEVLVEENNWRIYAKDKDTPRRKLRSGVSFYIDGVFYSPSRKFMAEVVREYRSKCSFTYPLYIDNTLLYGEKFGIREIPQEEVAFFLSSQDIELSSSREQIKEDEKNKEAIAEVLSWFNFNFAEWVTLDRSDEETLRIAERLPENLRNYALAMQGFTYKDVPIGGTLDLEEEISDENFAIPWEIRLSYRADSYFDSNNISSTLSTYAYQTSLSSSSFDKKDIPDDRIGRIPNKDGAIVKWTITDYLKHKFVVVNSKGGINPRDFLEKRSYNVTNPNNSFFIVRVNCDDTTVHPKKLVPLLGKLADKNILDIDFIPPDTKNKKSSSKNDSSNSIGKPNTKKFRREIRKLLPVEAVDTTRLNVNNVVSRAFGNLNSDGTVDLENLPTEIFYLTTLDVEKIRQILRNNSVRNDDPIYYVKSDEHLEVLKSLGFLPRPFEEFPIKRYEEILEELCCGVPSEFKDLAKAIITSSTLDLTLEGKVVSTKGFGTLGDPDICGNELTAYSLIRESLPVGKEIAESIGEPYPKELVKIFCDNLNSFRQVEMELSRPIYGSRRDESNLKLRSIVELTELYYDISLVPLSEKLGLRSLSIFNTYKTRDSIKSQAKEVLKRVFSERVLLYLSPFLDFVVSLPKELPKPDKDSVIEMLGSKELRNIDKMFPLYKWLNLERL